jgi:ankyrin repeat protein
MTPLHYTVRHNSKDIAKLLLRSGVSIDIGVQRRTWTRKFQDGYDVYELGDANLIPEIQISGVKGLTPLHYATLVGSSKMTDFLLCYRADPNALSHYGETPLAGAYRVQNTLMLGPRSTRE